MSEKIRTAIFYKLNTDGFVKGFTATTNHYISAEIITHFTLIENSEYIDELLNKAQRMYNSTQHIDCFGHLFYNIKYFEKYESDFTKDELDKDVIFKYNCFIDKFVVEDWQTDTLNVDAKARQYMKNKKGE
jgi:hypothetical protein